MSGSFRVLDASVSDDRMSWLEAWTQWPNREVQTHPAYAELFAGPDDRALAAFYTRGDLSVLYPFLLRDIPSKIVSSGLKDITSPYGYGGPVAWGEDPDETGMSAFWIGFDRWARSAGVVSEFIRFNLSGNASLPYPGKKVVRQQNIVVTIDLPDDDLMRSFEAKVRKNVKRSLREGVAIEVDTTAAGFDAFYPIYLQTMERRSAASGFFFPASFFEAIHRDLLGQFAYFTARHEGVVVSTELVLISEQSVYSFLGGTLPEAFALRPNDLLKVEIMRWARGQSKRSFVLGGGFEPGDGIERYKRSFAPEGIVEFVTGQRVLDEHAYDSLLVDRLAHGEVPDGFFPRYRA